MTDQTTADTEFVTASPDTLQSSSNDSGIGRLSHRDLVIILCSVLSVVGSMVISGVVLLCCRRRSQGPGLFARGTTPIDDDEIATWKVASTKKAMLSEHPTWAPDPAPVVGPVTPIQARDHSKQASAGSIKKPPSVIVYNNPGGLGHRSVDEYSPYSMHRSPYRSRISIDKKLPQTPIQARAPNARQGLTDESVPGDAPFLPPLKRQPSRISKLPPSSSSLRGYSSHSLTRTHSSKSSLHSAYVEYAWVGKEGSDMELFQGSREQIHSSQNRDCMRSCQQSRTLPRRGSVSAATPSSRGHGHYRLYSTSSIPPRMSLETDEFMGGGLSPRPLLPEGREEQIGRAIG